MPDGVSIGPAEAAMTIAMPLFPVISVIIVGMACLFIHHKPIHFLYVSSPVISITLLASWVFCIINQKYVMSATYIIVTLITLVALLGISWRPRRWLVAIVAHSVSCLLCLIFVIIIPLCSPLSNVSVFVLAVVIPYILFAISHALSLFILIRWYRSFTRQLAEQLRGLSSEGKAEIIAYRYLPVSRMYPLTDSTVALWITQTMLRQKVYGLRLCTLFSRIANLPYFAQVTIKSFTYALSFSYTDNESIDLGSEGVGKKHLGCSCKNKVIVGTKNITNIGTPPPEVCTIESLSLSKMLSVASASSILSRSPTENIFLKAVSSSDRHKINIQSITRLRLARYWADTIYMQSPPYRLSISRTSFYNDFRMIFATEAKELLRREIIVSFEGEQAIDIGGLKRELFTMVGDLLFSSISHDGSAPNMIVSESSNELTMSPNVLPLDAFCMGWLIGRCLCYGISLSSQLSRLFISLAMNISPTLADIIHFEPGLGNLISEAEKDDNSFSVLKESIPTLSRKTGWYKLLKFSASFNNERKTVRFRRINLEKVITSYLYPHSSKQLHSLRNGFRTALPAPGCYFIDAPLVHAIVVGAPSISIDDWRKHSIIDGVWSKPEVIEWFWEILKEDSELAAGILRFSCGISVPPQEGFCNLGQPLFLGQHPLPFTLQHCSKDRLPMGHTCTNTIQIPLVESKDDLRRALKIAAKVSSMDIK